MAALHVASVNHMSPCHTIGVSNPEQQQARLLVSIEPEPVKWAPA